jgi:hypothetical protein
LFGLMSTAPTETLGASSWINPSRFAPRSAVRKLMPVMLPPGRLRPDEEHADLLLDEARGADPFFLGRRVQFVALAARHAVPTIYFDRQGSDCDGIACCCARAASGHVAPAPPRSAMNSRRLMMRNLSPAQLVLDSKLAYLPKAAQAQILPS